MNDFIYEYIAIETNKNKCIIKKYNIDSYIHGLASSFEEALEKYKFAYSEVGLDENYDCVIIKHNMNILSKKDLDKSLAGIDVIKTIDNYCHKIMYVLDGKTFELRRSFTYFSIGAYIIFTNLNEEFYNKYKEFTKGALIKHRFTGDVYEILEGSESNELTLYKIWEQEDYTTSIKIKSISKGYIKTTDDIYLYNIIMEGE